jgi:putative transposase
VSCPKYRKAVLTSAVADQLKELLREKAKELNIEIEVIEVMSDHVHLFVTGYPKAAIQHIMNPLKGYSSRLLRFEFAVIRAKLPCMRSRSYCVGTVGYVSETAIRKYIAGQRGK